MSQFFLNHVCPFCFFFYCLLFFFFWIIFLSFANNLETQIKHWISTSMVVILIDDIIIYYLNVISLLLNDEFHKYVEFTINIYYVNNVQVQFICLFDNFCDEILNHTFLNINILTMIKSNIILVK